MLRAAPSCEGAISWRTPPLLPPPVLRKCEISASRPWGRRSGNPIPRPTPSSLTSLGVSPPVAHRLCRPCILERLLEHVGDGWRYRRSLALSSGLCFQANPASCVSPLIIVPREDWIGLRRRCTAHPRARRAPAAVAPRAADITSKLSGPAHLTLRRWLDYTCTLDSAQDAHGRGRGATAVSELIAGHAIPVAAVP